MASTFITDLQKKIRNLPTIIFPEADEEKILRAARRAYDQKICRPILLGQPDVLAELAGKLYLSLDRLVIMDYTNPAVIASTIEAYLGVSQDFSQKALQRKTKDPLNFAAMLVRLDVADSMIAGLRYTTGEVILASQAFIGMQEGISTVSSLGILDVPGFQGAQGEYLVIADCAVNAFPTPNERADIAIATADTIHKLMGWEPRVALLAYSTKGSAEHEKLQEITETLRIVRERRPDIAIDGEFQLDAAIVPAVAAKKVKVDSEVAGRANIVIFPDLNAGNIGVKLVQIFANASAHGPLLQGFAKPVSDMSRSAPVEEILGGITMLSVLAQRMP